MGAFIGILCVIFLLLKYSILNSFAYLINKKWCYFVNRKICDILPRQIFACLKLYSNFTFKPDYSIKKNLPDQFLIVCNHQSLFDIIAFYMYFGGKRVKFIAKNTLGGHVPLVSVMLKTDGHCLIERKGKPSQAMKALDNFSLYVAQNNWLPVLFPEGTRSKTGDLGIFHPAGFRRLTGNLKLPVAVFAIDGAWKINNIKNILKNLHDGCYKIKGLKIFPSPNGKTEQIETLNNANILISEQLKNWRNIK